MLTELLIKLVNTEIRLTHENNSKRGITKKTLKELDKVLTEINKIVNIDIEKYKGGTN